MRIALMLMTTACIGQTMTETEGVCLSEGGNEAPTAEEYGSVEALSLENELFPTFYVTPVLGTGSGLRGTTCDGEPFRTYNYQVEGEDPEGGLAAGDAWFGAGPMVRIRWTPQADRRAQIEAYLLERVDHPGPLTDISFNFQLDTGNAWAGFLLGTFGDPDSLELINHQIPGLEELTFTYD